MARRVNRLSEELGDGVFATKIDRASVDFPSWTECCKPIGLVDRVQKSQGHICSRSSHIVKSQTSSDMTWILPAVSVPPVPALLIILHYFELTSVRDLIQSLPRFQWVTPYTSILPPPISLPCLIKLSISVATVTSVLMKTAFPSPYRLQIRSCVVTSASATPQPP